MLTDERIKQLWDATQLGMCDREFRREFARAVEREARRAALLKIKAAAQELSDNVEEWDCDGLGLFAQHGWWEPLHDALEVLNDDSTT